MADASSTNITADSTAITADNTGNPPLGLRVPIESLDSPNLRYALFTQYGFSYRNITTTPAPIPPPLVNNPPFAQRHPIFLRDPAKRYDEGAQYGFTYNGGAQNATSSPTINNPNPTTYAIQTMLRASWPQDSWPAQRSFAFDVQPYPGDEPPGWLVPPSPDEWPQTSWRAQSIYNPIATLQPPLVVNTPPESSAMLLEIVVAWPHDTWPTQSAYAGLAATTGTYGQQPPNYSAAPLYGVRSAWLDAVWPAQSVAGKLVQPPFVSSGRDVRLKGAWPQADWPTQHRISYAPLILMYGDEPPRATQAQQYASRLEWPQDSWSAQDEPPAAQLINRVFPHVPPSRAMLNVLSRSWPVETWDEQTNRRRKIIQHPPLPPRYRSSHIEFLWPQITWPAQRSPLLAATTLQRHDNPPRRSIANLNVIETWYIPPPPQPQTSMAVSDPIIWALEIDDEFVITVPRRRFIVTAEHESEDDCGVCK